MGNPGSALEWVAAIGPADFHATEPGHALLRGSVVRNGTAIHATCAGLSILKAPYLCERTPPARAGYAGESGADDQRAAQGINTNGMAVGGTRSSRRGWTFTVVNQPYNGPRTPPPLPTSVTS
jgi:hypothetical protein